MGRGTRSGWAGLARAGVAGLAVAGCGFLGASAASTSHTRTVTNAAARVTTGLILNIGGPKPVHPIRAGFLGLSLEYTAIEPYAGTDPAAVNPVFVQLIRNLDPGQRPVLRIGGDSTDWTWVPVPGMSRPGGVRITLGPRWFHAMRSLTQALNAKLIMGIDLEANNPVLAAAEARAFNTEIGRGSIAALEPGNEPELYGSFAWYHLPDGTRVHSRPPTWDYSAYTQNFVAIAHPLSRARIAGPAAGSDKWIGYLPAFLNNDPRVSVATLHRYPVQTCYMPVASPKYPTIAHLLSPTASVGLAASVAADVAAAHAHGVPLRIDEINTDSCGSTPAVTHSFAAALWALDTAFAMAYAGVDGVNFHTYPKSTYELFSFKRSLGGWSGEVSPEYYGLMMFALAAPPGSLPLSLSGPAQSALRTWASRGADHRTRVLLINDSAGQGQNVLLRMAAGGPATLIRLRAPGLGATGGVTLGGQSLGQSTATGLLGGRERTETVDHVKGAYGVYVPPASAALVTF